MTAEQWAALESVVGRLITDDERAALDPLVDGRQDVEVAAFLSIGRTRIESPRMVSARGIAGRYAGGALASEVVLLKLEGARDAMLASADAGQRVFGSLLRRQLGFLTSDGLDFGDPTLRGQIDQLVTVGVIAAEEAGHLKALAEVPDPLPVHAISRALNIAEGREVL